ncbi:MAG: hypothetical protein HQK52_22755 [Oligoflexia bacterium]|nr:hypothetical protein [Oligoflexia bacterium]
MGIAKETAGVHQYGNGFLGCNRPLTPTVKSVRPSCKHSLLGCFFKNNGRDFKKG